MESMVSGSPVAATATGLNSSMNDNSSSKAFLPHYLMGQKTELTASPSAMAGIRYSQRTPCSSSGPRPAHLRVTWSPELNQTNYYEANNNNSSSSLGGGVVDFSGTTTTTDFLYNNDAYTTTTGSTGAAPNSVHYYNSATSSSKFAPSNKNNNGIFMGGPPISSMNNEIMSRLSSAESVAIQNNVSASLESRTNNGADHHSLVIDRRVVTVFGFVPDSIATILQHFSHCGTIIAYEVPNKCNWVHLKFESKLQVRRALDRNGRIINENMKIGVELCSDEKVLARLNNEKTLGFKNGEMTNNTSATTIATATSILSSPKFSSLTNAASCDLLNVTTNRNNNNNNNQGTLLGIIARPTEQQKQNHQTKSNMRSLTSHSSSCVPTTQNNISNGYNTSSSRSNEDDNIISKAKYFFGW